MGYSWFQKPGTSDSVCITVKTGDVYGTRSTSNESVYCDWYQLFCMPIKGIYVTI